MSTRPEVLSPQAIEEQLRRLAGWSFVDGKLKKSFVFVDFVQAFGWMTKAALEAERLNHHPNWANVYKTVDVELSTHDVGGVTELDVKLATAMNRHMEPIR